MRRLNLDPASAHLTKDIIMREGLKCQSRAALPHTKQQRKAGSSPPILILNSVRKVRWAWV